MHGDERFAIAVLRANAESWRAPLEIRAHSRRLIALAVVALAVVLSGVYVPRSAGASGGIVVNDDYASAAAVTTFPGPPSFVRASVDITAATVEPGEPGLNNFASGAVAKTAWWSWTVPRDMVINTGGSYFTLYTVNGPGFAGLTELWHYTGGAPGIEMAVTAGTVIAIQIGARAGDDGIRQVDITELPDPPANDDYANATALDLGVTSSTVNLGGATTEAGEPPPDQYPVGAKTAWWVWTAPDDLRVRLSFCGQESYLYVASAPGFAGLQRLNAPNANGTDFDAIAGHTYAIQCVAQPFSTGYSARVTVSLRPPPPPNDDLTDAASTTFGASMSADGSGATVEPGEPLPSWGQFPAELTKSAWWTFDALAGRRFHVSLHAGCEFATVFAETGPGMAGLSSIGDSRAPGASSDGFDVTTTIDGSYAVQCAQTRHTTGSMLIEVDQFAPPPANDDYANAVPLQLGVVDGAEFQGATSEPGEPGLSFGRTAWWTYTAPNDVHLHLMVTHCGVKLYAVSGPGFPGLTPLGSLGDFDVSAGTTVAFQIDCIIHTDIELTAPPPPANDNYADAVPLVLGQVDPVDPVGATLEPAEPGAGATTYYNDIVAKTTWWIWTAPSDLWIHVSDAGGSVASCGGEYTGIYTVNGPGLSGLTFVHAVSPPFSYDFFATAGTEYAFQCGYPNGFAGGQGTGPAISQLPRSVGVSSAGVVPGTVTITGPQGSFVVNAAVTTVRPGDLPPGAVNLSGALSYTIGGLTPGSTVQVTINLPAGSAPTAAFKSAGSGYLDASNIASINGDSVTLTLTDGGSGDADGAANGSITDPVVITKRLTAPTAPAVGTVSPGSSAATLTWTAPSANGGSPVTGYVVTPYVGSTAQVARTFNSTATTQTITGLSNKTTYTFRVAAKNSVGTGTQSAASGAVTVGAPVAPTAIVATPGNGTAALRWTAPTATNGSAITGYVVTPLVGSTAQAARTFNSSATSQTITGLTNGTPYTFRVQAKNANGTGPSGVSGAMVVGTPLAPTGVTATGGNGQAVVHWTAPASSNGSAVVGYVVTPYLGSAAQTAKSFASTATTQTVTGLQNAKTYTFVVAATNARGTGPGSSASPPVKTAPLITPGGGAVTEGNSGTVTVNVPVALSSAQTVPVTVHYATVDAGTAGIATAGVDYVATSGTVTFAPGETSKTVPITVFGDTVKEPPAIGGEWILVAFNNPTGGAVIDTSFYGLGLGIILDDD